jgi:RNA polymerase sigma factor (sigma-70 family)
MEKKEGQASGFGKDAEATLYEKAQGGCAESQNMLLGQHEGLVRVVVRRQWLAGLPEEEALQAGRYGLWRAVLGYDAQRGTAFSTYAYVAIMRYVWSAVQGELRRRRREVPRSVLALYFSGTAADPAREQEQTEVEQALWELVARLPERLRQVIEARYGLEVGERQTLAEIGGQLGVCGERVRQLQQEALVWLRHPAHSQEIRSLLTRHTRQEYERAQQLAGAWKRQRAGRHGR